MKNITLSENDQTVALNQIKTILKWDDEKEGFAGTITYKKGYLPDRTIHSANITKEEISFLAKHLDPLLNLC